MVKRYLSINVLTLIVLFVLSFRADAQQKSEYKEYPVINFTGDEPPNPNSKKFTGDLNAVMNLKPYTTTYTDGLLTLTDVFTGLTTFYDFVSNAVPQHIVQHYLDTIHLVLMRNMTPGIPTSYRRVAYTVSTDGGLSWTVLDTSIWNYSSGYPYLGELTDGSAVIGMHAITPGYSAHSVVCTDISPLVGVFQICDPSLLPGSQLGVWTRIVTTSLNKVAFVASINITTEPDIYSNILTNTMYCAFTGWQPIPDVGNAERYVLARASDGKIGLAYIRNDAITSNAGDVRFIESTDDGVTWSSPITIYDAQPNSSNFLGGLRGIDLVYIGNSPKVIFDLEWQTDQGTYFPGMCGKIMFWSPDVNGGNPVVVADSTNTPWHSAEGMNDGFTPICRGSIGKTRNNLALFSTYNVARAEVWPPLYGNHYFDVYIAWSIDGGATWFGREKVTNLSGPLRDCRFPNLSPENDCDNSHSCFSNIEYLSDSIPGFTTSGAEESPAQQHFLRAMVYLFGGVNNNGGKLPSSYKLFQNYPNPFNPITKIKFAVSEYAKITLKVYDVTGKEITELVNGNMEPGNYEAEWNAQDSPSGVYFYELRTENFISVRKMVLIK